MAVSQCVTTAPVSALCPRDEISPVAVVFLALACLNKKKKNNNNNNREATMECINYKTTTMLTRSRRTTAVNIITHV